MGKRIAHEVNAAALPGSMKHLAHGGLDAFMGIGDDEFDAAQAAPCELAQELSPEGFGFGWRDVHSQDFSAPLAVSSHRDDDRHRHDATVLARLYVGRVDPEVRPVAFDGPLQEGLHLAVDLLAEPADLALGDAAHAHGLDEIVDRPRQNAIDVSFLDNRAQGLLNQPPRLQEGREIAAFPELGDTQLNRPGAGFPQPIAVTVALVAPIGTAFSGPCSSEALNFP